MWEFCREIVKHKISLTRADNYKQTQIPPTTTCDKEMNLCRVWKIPLKPKVNSSQTTNKPVNEAFSQTFTNATEENYIQTPATLTTTNIKTTTTTKKEDNNKQQKVASTQTKISNNNFNVVSANLWYSYIILRLAPGRKGKREVTHLIHVHD